MKLNLYQKKMDTLSEIYRISLLMCNGYWEMYNYLCDREII